MKQIFYPVVFVIADPLYYKEDVVIWTSKNTVSYTRFDDAQWMSQAIAREYNVVAISPEFAFSDEEHWWDIKHSPAHSAKDPWGQIWRTVDITNYWEDDNTKYFLSYIQWQAKKEYDEYSQDVHSQEYKTWLQDRAVFYNNGFYEYSLTHSIKTRDVKTVSDTINARYEELYTCSEYKIEKYSGVYSEKDSSFTIAKYNGKIVVFGTGTDECGSDWLEFCIFHVYDKLEDVDALKRPTVHVKKANGTDVTKLHDFCALYKKTL